MDNEMILNVIGLLLTGGIISRVFDRFFMSKKDEQQSLILLVQQLQTNVNSNNIKVDNLQKEVDHWKLKFYEELEQKNSLKEQVTKLTAQLSRFSNKISES